MDGNPHYTLLQREIIDHSSALINAVLAVAFEQRTANLIAYMENNPTAVTLDGIDVTVRQRLGLNPDPMGVIKNG